MTFPSAARLSSASRSDATPSPDAGIVFGVTHAIHIVLKLLKFATDEHVTEEGTNVISVGFSAVQIDRGSWPVNHGIPGSPVTHVSSTS